MCAFMTPVSPPEEQEQDTSPPLPTRCYTTAEPESPTISESWALRWFKYFFFLILLTVVVNRAH